MSDLVTGTRRVERTRWSDRNVRVRRRRRRASEKRRKDGRNRGEDVARGREARENTEVQTDFPLWRYLLFFALLLVSSVLSTTQATCELKIFHTRE